MSRVLLGLAIGSVVGCFGVSAATAAPVIDGTRDVEYGSARAVQTVQTQFGDSVGGVTSGGELDAAYATIVGGRLYVLLTGNQEPNSNTFDIFIDSKTGGENVLSGAPQYDANNTSGYLGGLTFDTGFTADYHLFGRWGGGAYALSIVDRLGGTSAAVNGNAGVATVGAGTPIQFGTTGTGTTAAGAAATFLTQTVDFAFNNTNAAGVTGGTGAADQAAAAAVLTGLEFSIALADLGNPGVGDVIRIAALYNNGDHNYLSNQTLGGLPAGTGNLGGDGAGGFTGTVGGVNFNNFAGDQFFTITVPDVPEPASLALLGLGGVLAGRRRRD